MRYDFGPESDIDLLIEFEPELSELFTGRKIDLRTAEETSFVDLLRMVNEVTSADCLQAESNCVSPDTRQRRPPGEPAPLIMSIMSIT